MKIAQTFEVQYPSLNVFLSRGDATYQHRGRYEDYKEALSMDDRIVSFLDKYNIDYTEFDFRAVEGIIEFVEDNLYEDTNR